MDSIKELKAEAYDCITAIEMNQLKLKQINQQILELLKAEKEEKQPSGE